MNHEATIRRDIERWTQQYNDHDAASLAAWYTAESVYITPTGVALVGPEQIHGYFRASFSRAPEARVAVTVGAINVAGPDLMVGTGTFEISNLVDPAGKRLPPVKGPWVSTFAMQKDGWVPIVHASAITLEAYAPVHA